MSRKITTCLDCKAFDITIRSHCSMGFNVTMQPVTLIDKDGKKYPHASYRYFPTGDDGKCPKPKTNKKFVELKLEAE